MSYGYQSSFGGLIKPSKIINSQIYDGVSYLMLNTEFLEDIELNGFQVNAIKIGNFSLTVSSFLPSIFN